MLCCVCIDKQNITVMMFVILSCPLVETPVLIATIVAALLRICFLLMLFIVGLSLLLGIYFLLILFIVGLFLVRLCVSIQKQKESSQAVNEGPEPLDAIYEDLDAAVVGNFQPSALQNVEIGTADNVAYSTKLQFLQNKEIDAQENVAYCAKSMIT